MQRIVKKLDFRRRHRVRYVSGAGYIHPSNFAMDFAPQYRDKVWKEYQLITDKYMRKLDMSWVHIFRWGDLKTCPLKKYADIPSMKSIFSDYWGNFEYEKTHYMVDDIPVFHALKDTNLALVKDPVNILMKNIPEKRPLFVHIALTNWVWPYDKIKKFTDDLPEDFIVVRPDELELLYRQWKTQQ